MLSLHLKSQLTGALLRNFWEYPEDGLKMPSRKPKDPDPVWGWGQEYRPISPSDLKIFMICPGVGKASVPKGILCCINNSTKVRNAWRRHPPPPTSVSFLSGFWGMYLCWHCATCTCEVIRGPGPQLACLAGVLIKDILVLFTRCAGPTAADFSLPDHLRQIFKILISFSRR